MSLFKKVSKKTASSSHSISIKALLVAAALSLPFVSNATVVEVQTNVGNFQINLFDETTPGTVENFLSYVNAGAYTNNVVHRSIPAFVVQAGGYQYNNSFPPDVLATSPAINNEPELSNLRGTVAMAKLTGNPNSATSQWFVNVVDNTSLDTNNGGFSVFGQVLGDGMQIIDAINQESRFNFGGAFEDFPMRDITADEINSGTEPDETNLIIITDIVVVDPATVTNPDLNPAPNTLIETRGPDNLVSQDDAGALGVLLIASLAGFAIQRRRKASALRA
ncbi:peptidylprolyl isomerase [Glaciecola sp. MH2013]|uniref:peptidylprolyl isomerase n=1 Tax=Glaciecola sp. MH2013 TaxID=2785524 RepID=UPI00189D2EE7|nr:peptidylprolyl isomerase [Glaciecola sp. MH2013]MBF7073500.1 peptidylprolyl isomerase [Glaciecola sp. MH2013]